MKKVLVLGNSKSGKTTAAEMISKILGSPPPKNCSDFIIEDYAAGRVTIPSKALELAKSIAKNKDPYRQDLFKFGLMRQKTDPAYPVSEAVKQTNVVTGVRTKENLDASRNLFDLVLWIDRDEAVANSTDQLGPSDADVVIDNNGTLGDLKVALISELVD